MTTTPASRSSFDDAAASSSAGLSSTFFAVELSTWSTGAVQVSQRNPAVAERPCTPLERQSTANERRSTTECDRTPKFSSLSNLFRADDRQAEITGVTVIIPAFNEELCISDTIDELVLQLDLVALPYEIIVVNDGSTDGTGEILRRRADIRLIEHATNRGYGASLKAGVRMARHAWIAITDADGTYPNQQLPRLLELARTHDMVVGARVGANVEYPWLRRLPKWFLVRFAEWVARQPIPDLNSGLRVFRRSEALRFLNILPDGFSFTTTITLALLTNGYRVHYEPIDYHRRVGQSKFHPIRDTLRLLRTIIFTGMYFAPLRLFLPIAALFFTGFLGTLSGDLFVRQNLTERTLILFVASTQLGMFSLLADMIDKRSAR